MKITIRARHLDLTTELQDEIRRRIHLAFGRLGSWVRAVDVTVADINGPKGGADKQCRLRVRGPALAGVFIEQIGVASLPTIASALDRAEQVIVRKMSRRRSFAPLLAT